MLGALVALGPLTIDITCPRCRCIADELSISSSVAQLTLTGTLAGLAVGQLIVDVVALPGRRRPLMAESCCMSLAALPVRAEYRRPRHRARTCRVLGAAAAMVVAIAVVGDLFSDTVAATVLSRLMLVLGVAPVVAPSLGAAVLLYASWHWVFAVLVVLGGALLLVEQYVLETSHRLEDVREADHPDVVVADMGDFMGEHARQLAKSQAAQKAFRDAKRIAGRRANRECIHRLAWNHVKRRGAAFKPARSESDCTRRTMSAPREGSMGLALNIRMMVSGDARADEREHADKDKRPCDAGLPKQRVGRKRGDNANPADKGERLRDIAEERARRRCSSSRYAIGTSFPATSRRYGSPDVFSSKRLVDWL